MSTLFTVTKSWFDLPSLYEQIGYAAQGDSILLIQDAVLALHSPVALASFTAKAQLRGVQVFALEEDCQIRGIENKYDLVKCIDYAAFVVLVTKHSKQIAW